MQGLSCAASRPFADLQVWPYEGVEWTPKIWEGHRHRLFPHCWRLYDLESTESTKKWSYIIKYARNPISPCRPKEVEIGTWDWRLVTFTSWKGVCNSSVENSYWTDPRWRYSAFAGIKGLFCTSTKTKCCLGNSEIKIWIYCLAVSEFWHWYDFPFPYLVSIWVAPFISLKGVNWMTSFTDASKIMIPLGIDFRT